MADRNMPVQKALSGRRRARKHAGGDRLLRPADIGRDSPFAGERESMTIRDDLTDLLAVFKASPVGERDHGGGMAREKSPPASPCERREGRRKRRAMYDSLTILRHEMNSVKDHRHCERREAIQESCQESCKIECLRADDKSCVLGSGLLRFVRNDAP